MEANPTRPEGEAINTVGITPPTVANPPLDASLAIQPVNMAASNTIQLANAETLETLPAEIKLGIMRLLPDTYTLRALVLSSPSYHAVYVAQRKSILYAVLSRVLGRKGLFDALIVHKTSHGPPGFLNSQRGFIHARYYLNLIDHYTADDFAAVAGHQHVMDGLAFEYKTCDVGVARGQAIDYPDRPLKSIYQSFYAVELYNLVEYNLRLRRPDVYLPYKDLDDFIECENDRACVLSYIYERCIDADRQCYPNYVHPPPVQVTDRCAYLTPQMLF